MDVMNWLQSSAAEKLLITDNVNNGNQLVKRLNRQGQSVRGLTVTTAARIAKEIMIRDLASKGECRRIREIADDIGAFILEGILRAYPEKYPFVPQESLCTATAAEILSNLNLIRENRVTKDYEKAEDPKISQLNQLIQDYEARLKELDFYDDCMLLRAGMNALKENDHVRSSCPVGVLYADKVSVLEMDFLKAYAPDAVFLTFPLIEEKPSWHFYKSYGIWNEAEWILQQIRERQIPFGQVRILYTSQDYEPSLLAAFGERRVPICFPGGRPVSGENSVRMLLSLVSWAANGYRYENLKSVVLNPLFALPVQDGDAPVNGSKEFFKGIDDKIGWGLERYQKFLKTAKEKTSHKEAFLTFLQDAVNIFVDLNGTIDAALLWETLTSFTKKYSRRAEEHKFIRPLLDKEQRELSFMLPLPDLKEALELLKDRLEHLSLEDSERSDAVAACRISGVEILDRPYIFVIGLADRHYGSALIESPVLNDVERGRYFDLSTGNVTLSADQAARRLENYVKSLELSETEEIHMGYCCFDTVKQEELSPSALFLNMREKYGADREELPVAEYPRVLAEDTAIAYGKVWGIEPAEEAEENEGDAENGKERTSPDASNTEIPVNEMSLAFSPSSMDLMLSCPANYNFQKNRRLPQEDYAKPDSGVWLGANDKGNFFHLILQDYITEEFIGQTAVSAEVNQAAFERIFAKAAKITEEQVPIEAPATARQEKEEIREAALHYLEKLHAEFSQPGYRWQVLACEKEFGMNEQPAFCKDYDYIRYDEPDEMDLMLADPDEDAEMQKTDSDADPEILYHDLWHLSFRGKIDRLDGYQDPNGIWHYRIVDYKTGSHENFVKYKLDKTLQHHIYQMYMSQNGQVDEFMYHFPFEEKEEDQVISITEFYDPMYEDDNYILQVLHLLFVEGYFPAMTKTGGCSYCKYSDICISRIRLPEE